MVPLMSYPTTPPPTRPHDLLLLTLPTLPPTFPPHILPSWTWKAYPDTSKLPAHSFLPPHIPTSRHLHLHCSALYFTPPGTWSSNTLLLVTSPQTLDFIPTLIPSFPRVVIYTTCQLTSIGVGLLYSHTPTSPVPKPFSTHSHSLDGPTSTSWLSLPPQL